MKWYAIVFVAIVLEGIIEYVKLAIQKKMCWEILGAIAVGELAAFAFGLDLFAIAGIQAVIPYVGTALTGIIVARGSNYIFDLIGKLTEAQEQLDNPVYDPIKDEDVDDVEGVG